MYKYYEAGSMNPHFPSKAHIMDDTGKCLCGVKGYWIESSLRTISKDGIIEGLEHLPGSIFDHACKKCVKKFKLIWKFG